MIKFFQRKIVTSSIRQEENVWHEVFRLILDLKELKQHFANVMCLRVIVHDFATIFISVVYNSSEIIRCSYQYTVSEMGALKS
jgi:hypothetical protein